MGLYNRSAMAAILDICKLANFQTQTEKSVRFHNGIQNAVAKSKLYSQYKHINNVFQIVALLLRFVSLQSDRYTYLIPRNEHD